MEDLQLAPVKHPAIDYQADGESDDDQPGVIPMATLEPPHATCSVCWRNYAGTYLVHSSDHGHIQAEANARFKEKKAFDIL